MPISIPDGAGLVTPQVLASTTNANGREEQHVRASGTVALALATGSLTTAQASAGTGAGTATATLTASGVEIANAVGVTIKGGATPGSRFIFEFSDDNQATWYPTTMMSEQTGVAVSDTGPFAASEARSFISSIISITHFRVRQSVLGSAAAVTIGPVVMPVQPSVAAVLANPSTAQVFSLTPAFAGVSTAAASEALATLVPQRNLTAAATNTTHTVTAGKTLRILGFQATFRGVAATATVAHFALRAVLTGTVAATSPIVAHVVLTVPAAANSHVFAAANMAPFLELPSGASFGVTTGLSIANTGSLSWPSVMGLEY